MNTPPKIGTTHEKRFTVEPAHAVELAVGDLPAVLSTPWLIWFLEHAALELMQPYLEEGEITAGVGIEMEHTAPSLVGDDVVCTAQVVHADGPAVSFRIEARDAGETLATGLHKRMVVPIDRLRKRLEKKKGSVP